ncbi:MAG: LolA-like outer membrane lipoprotein chaperone [Campylobacteraceae bacterium]|jgi:outer membrane lipoprotein carrier protein|nr:LolA-like outer membrane lipoprotein chaperone [Campylobacteraceae bacterium]
MRFLAFLLLCVTFLNAEGGAFKSISSDFTQTIKSSENDTIKYSGSFQATSEGDNNFALWHYKTPIIKKIYFANNDVIILEPDLEQAVITTVDEIPDISHVLNEALKANKLTNKEITVNIANVDYKISFQKNTPFKIAYTDALDNKIEILLRNTILNTNIDKRTFQAEIPTNYDIVRY